MKHWFPINRQVILEISGTTMPIRGKIIDIGQDIIVVHNGTQFVYIPLVQLQQLCLDPSGEQHCDMQELPFEYLNEPISYRKVLLNAKGMFAEIYVTGNQSIHGYVTSVMNDYFIFYSPVYHTVVIPMHHLKYLIPYIINVTPYTMTPEQFPLKPSQITMARTFVQQLQKLSGRFVVFDLGENPNKIGILKKTEQNIIELAGAGGSPVFIHYDHIKSVHLP